MKTRLKVDKRPSWKIIAPSRLHLGFIELSQSAPRCFGSIGIALQDPTYQITYHSAPKLSIDGDVAEEMSRLINHFDKQFEVRSTGKINILEAIPRHSGLGSGTQLALATGHLLAKVHQLSLSSHEIATIFERGKRSGIGIAAFDHGGFIVDGGKSKQNQIPPTVSRLTFPEEWRIILLFDHSTAKGLHGADEVKAFVNLKYQKIFHSKQLSYIILMAILPSLIEKDYDSFSQALGQFQQITGDFFAVVQGGRYRDGEIGKILEYLNEKDIKAIGQSSWGPTAYVIARNRQHSQDIQSLIRKFIEKNANTSENHIEILDTAANSRGSVIKCINNEEH